MANLYGVATGTNAYSLRVNVPADFTLQVGDIVTIDPVNANTGPATLSINDLSPYPLVNKVGAALIGGELQAGRDIQCTFTGAAFSCDLVGAAEIRAAIVVTDNGNAGDVNQIAATGATLQEGLLLSVTLASPIYSNGSLYLALNSGTAYQAICATVKGAGYRGVSTGEVEAGIPYLFQWSTIGGGRWILQSRSYLAPGDMPGGMLFEATKKSGQTTSAAGTARLTWNAASRNDGHLTVSGTDNVTMTAVYTGVYEVNYTTFGTGNTGVIVYKNGSIFAIGSLIDGGSYPYICCLVPLTAGDTIEIYLYTASALTIDVSLAQARVLRIARVV